MCFKYILLHKESLYTHPNIVKQDRRRSRKDGKNHQVNLMIVMVLTTNNMGHTAETGMRG